MICLFLKQSSPLPGGESWRGASGELERGFQESWRGAFRRAGEGLSGELERGFFFICVDNIRLLLWISVDNYAFRVAYCV